MIDLLNEVWLTDAYVSPKMSTTAFSTFLSEIVTESKRQDQ